MAWKWGDPDSGELSGSRWLLQRSYCLLFVSVHSGRLPLNCGINCLFLLKAAVHTRFLNVGLKLICIGLVKFLPSHRVVVGVSVLLLRLRIWRPKYFILYCIVLCVGKYIHYVWHSLWCCCRETGIQYCCLLLHSTGIAFPQIHRP